jgi:hypothetical protein
MRPSDEPTAKRVPLRLNALKIVMKSSVQQYQVEMNPDSSVSSIISGKLFRNGSVLIVRREKMGSLTKKFKVHLSACLFSYLISCLRRSGTDVDHCSTSHSLARNPSPRPDAKTPCTMKTQNEDEEEEEEE